ncbi:MAG: diguanylate cyclase, partial [Alphaproteobacteria bacterium]|nr:diguanylate cyclase [Alphaproteobacteria bacterium]
YGGEEFALILPGCAPSIMADLAERVRSSVADLAIAHGASSVSPSVTVSLGMACLGLSCDGNTYPQAAEAARGGGGGLVKSADQALYQAKQSGRNRAVCVIEPIEGLETGH